jgi:hypothetical protein
VTPVADPEFVISETVNVVGSIEREKIILKSILKTASGST